MADMYFYAKFLVYMFSQVLGRVYAAVSAACAAEREHQICKSTFHVACHVCISQLVYRIKKCENFAVVLQELDYGSIKAGERLVLFVTSGIVCASAVKYISASVARGIFGNTFLVAETEYAYN